MAGTVHRPAHRDGLPAFDRGWDQERLEPRGVAVRRVEPGGVVAAVEDDRHAVVQRAQQVVRIGGQDGEGLDDGRRGRLAVLPPGPETGEGEGEPILAADQVGLLRLGIQLLPLVEAVGDDQAAAAAKAVAVGGLLGGALGAGVDHAVADGRVLGPGRDQAPAQKVQGARRSRRDDAHHRRFLGRRQVVARQDRRHVHQLEDLGDHVAG